MVSTTDASSNENAAPSKIIDASAAKEGWTVEAVVQTIPGGPPKADSESPVPFFHILERLKTTKREGWRRFGIAHGESISDHMYRMSLITLFAPPSLASKIDIPRCTKMALIHDMAEALVGDITPVDGVSKQEKSRREETTMDYFTKGLLGRVQGGLTGEDIKAVWREYEDGETLESKYVHDIDKIELLLQMVEYERVHKTNLDLGEFSWVSTRVQLPEMQEWSREIMREREELWGGKEHATFDTGKLPDATKLAQGLEHYGGEK